MSRKDVAAKEGGRIRKDRYNRRLIGVSTNGKDCFSHCVQLTQCTPCKHCSCCIHCARCTKCIQVYIDIQPMQCILKDNRKQGTYACTPCVQRTHRTRCKRCGHCKHCRICIPCLYYIPCEHHMNCQLFMYRICCGNCTHRTLGEHAKTMHAMHASSTLCTL